MQATKDVEQTLHATNNLMDIGVDLLKEHPAVLPTLRMATCPPLAVDRLIGLAGVSPHLVKVMDKKGVLPPRMAEDALNADLVKIGEIIRNMADPDIFGWIRETVSPSGADVYRAATIVADRLCGAVANPIIRNAQEKRQFVVLSDWLKARGYRDISAENTVYTDMQPGTFSFHSNVPVEQEGGGRSVNISVDVSILPKDAEGGGVALAHRSKVSRGFHERQ